MIDRTKLIEEARKYVQDTSDEFYENYLVSSLLEALEWHTLQEASLRDDVENLVQENEHAFYDGVLAERGKVCINSIPGSVVSCCKKATEDTKGQD